MMRLASKSPTRRLRGWTALTTVVVVVLSLAGCGSEHEKAKTANTKGLCARGISVQGKTYDDFALLTNGADRLPELAPVGSATELACGESSGNKVTVSAIGGIPASIAVVVADAQSYQLYVEHDFYQKINGDTDLLPAPLPQLVRASKGESSG